MHVKVMVVAGNQMIAFSKIRNFINPTVCPHRCIEETNKQTKNLVFHLHSRLNCLGPNLKNKLSFGSFGGPFQTLNLSVNHLRLKP